MPLLSAASSDTAITVAPRLGSLSGGNGELARRRNAVKLGSGADQANCFQNRNDTVLKTVLSNFRAGRWRRDMKNLARYRAMESLCRQSAVFHPHDSWRLLAQAEMWHHKAEDELAARSVQSDVAAPAGALVRTESQGRAAGANRSLGADGI